MTAGKLVVEVPATDANEAESGGDDGADVASEIWDDDAAADELAAAEFVTVGCRLIVEIDTALVVVEDDVC